MAVPKERTSKSNKRSRRGHLALQRPTLATCSQCKKLKRPHTICPNCGYYDGREVLETE
ncbi:MAG TPA: 50S ribosomal protein L32 [Candidatus Solibacter sp.]|jgi:large subunit ribosomal protein L32|nr:50S ribosomal protein L32 [Candidatus Solibacter sp.]